MIMNTDMVKCLKKSIIRELYYSLDYMHLYLILEAISTKKNERKTVCFKYCSIVKFSFASSVINMLIDNVSISNQKENQKEVIINFSDNQKGSLILLCSDVRIMTQGGQPSVSTNDQSRPHDL